MQKTVVMMAFILLAGGGAAAQEISLEDQQSTQVETVREQSAGSYNVMNMEYITSLGMQQKAWNNPMENLGEGQSRPGYSRYLWKADTVLPIRLREGMMTLINFPSWELVENVWIGAKDAFYGEIPAPNALMLYPAAGVSGVDSNLVVFGRSGNRYAFYLRSETYNTDRITHSVVDVAANAPAKTQAGGVGGGGRIGGSGGAGGTKLPRDGDPDWMESVPTNPEAFRFDIDIFIPNPEDVDIAPERVWRDEIFTYIDFGDKSLGMNQRPVVNMILQESETPVGFRTKGKYGRLMIGSLS